MPKRVCCTLQLTLASLALLSCALPEVAAWIPPVEMTPAEAAAPADPIASAAAPDSGVSSMSKPDAAGMPDRAAADGGASTTPDAGNGAAASSGSAGAAGTESARCACAAEAPCCDGCNLMPDGASCAFAGPAQCLEGGACQAGLCTPKVKARFCLVSNMCYREGQAAPRYDCLYCAPERVQDRFSPRPAGTPCDDKVWCNGTDACGQYGQCTQSSGSTCPQGQFCDESSDSCLSPPPPSTARSGS